MSNDPYKFGRSEYCSHCNHAIGKFNDDVRILGRAIEYLLEP